MMKRFPMLTLLSPSRSRSLRVQELFSEMFRIEPLASAEKQTHVMDSSSSAAAVPWALRGGQWHSVVSQCPVSKTLIHFLSMEGGGFGNNKSNDNPLSLIGITTTTLNENNDVRDAVEQSQRLLTEHVVSHGNIATFPLRRWLLGQSLSLQHLRRHDLLPFLDLPRQQQEHSIKEETSATTERHGLKEVVWCSGGAAVTAVLSESALTRSALGVYQWPDLDDGLRFRPLPVAMEDWKIPSPCLVFHADDLDQMLAEIMPSGVTTARIGYGGGGNRNAGQIMLFHPDWHGLEIRLCPSHKVSTCFAEAQESLLAGSLGELQSSHVLKDGTPATMTTTEKDPRTLSADCWVEFRANFWNPQTFWNKMTAANKSPLSLSSPPNVRVAKTPDLPPE